MKFEFLSHKLSQPINYEFIYVFYKVLAYMVVSDLQFFTCNFLLIPVFQRIPITHAWNLRSNTLTNNIFEVMVAKDNTGMNKQGAATDRGSSLV